MQVQLVELTPDVMIEEALAGPSFQAMSPDSSLWIDQLDRRWGEAQQVQEGAIAPSLVGESVRYAVSPVVIASLGRCGSQPGLAGAARRLAEHPSSAQPNDPDFRWSHPSTNVASGLLATLAEFYAGAGKTRGLTRGGCHRPEHVGLRLGHRAHGQVLRRGRGDDHAAHPAGGAQLSGRLRGAGASGGQLQPPEPDAIGWWRSIPAEGTLWADHPLALLETGAVTDNQRQTFGARCATSCSRPMRKQIVLEAGFRPADLSLSLAGSPIALANGVDPSQPQTTLQVPGPAVVDVVQNVWQYTKRKANVYLVVDTSGSMEGEKLAAAQAALREFLSQIKGDQEQVGLVEFSSTVNNIDPLDELGNNRSAARQQH